MGFFLTESKKPGVWHPQGEHCASACRMGDHTGSRSRAKRKNTNSDRASTMDAMKGHTTALTATVISALPKSRPFLTGFLQSSGMYAPVYQKMPPMFGGILYVKRSLIALAFLCFFTAIRRGRKIYPSGSGTPARCIGGKALAGPWAPG